MLTCVRAVVKWQWGSPMLDEEASGLTFPTASPEPFPRVCHTCSARADSHLGTHRLPVRGCVALMCGTHPYGDSLVRQSLTVCSVTCTSVPARLEVMLWWQCSSWSEWSSSTSPAAVCLAFYGSILLSCLPVSWDLPNASPEFSWLVL